MALALVMIYQATHLVNFAQGEIAMFATYLAWTLMQAGMPYWAAFFLTVAIAFIGGVVLSGTSDEIKQDEAVRRSYLGY